MMKLLLEKKQKKQSRIQLAVEISGQSGLSEWVDVDNKALKGVFKNVPARDELSSDISEQLIVELYSK
jgi:small subunit ribosomal protein S4